MNFKIVILLVLLAGAGLVLADNLEYISIKQIFLGDDNQTTAVTKPEKITTYLQLDPPFIVNFSHLDELRYLQISLVAMHSNPQTLELVEKHMPAVRNALILLLSDQGFEKLNTLDGKNQLRRQMLIAINRIISNYGSESMLDGGDIFITNFVMQ